MHDLNRIGIAAFALFGLSVLFRIALTLSGTTQGSVIKLSGILIGLALGAVLCWAVFTFVMAPVGRLLTGVARLNPDGAVFVVVTDTHLDSALRELGIERARKNRFLALVADLDGIRLVASRRGEQTAAFEWGEIQRLSVGSARSKWSVSSWSNVIMRVRLASGVLEVPLSVMPGRSLGNYTTAQMLTVINKIESKRPSQPGSVLADQH